MKHLRLPACLFCLLAVTIAGAIEGDTSAPSVPRVEVILEQAAEHAPAIGVNEFGDSGGTHFSAGNLIPDSGFEPINIRRSWRVTRVGFDKGYSWIEVDGGGMTDYDLTTTGYLNGASYRLYRIVDPAGRALPATGPDGYLEMSRADRFVRIGEGRVPEPGARNLPRGGWVDEPGERRIYLDGPRPEVWDYIFFEKRVLEADPAWSHPRLDGNGASDAVAETWRPAWGSEESGLRLTRRLHAGAVPDAMAAGAGYYAVTAPRRGATGIHGPYIFFPRNDNPEGNWYATLEPGKTYRYEVWMRSDGLGDGNRVELGFFSLYDDISHVVAVDRSWRLYGFTFTAPAAPTHDGWHGGPAIRFRGPGTLELDAIRLFRQDDPSQIDEIFVPSPFMHDELMASQPERAEKGILRSMYTMLNNATMASLLSLHRDVDVVYDWYVGIEAGTPMTLPAMLDYAYRTGSDAASRMKPWLNISSRAPEEEWLMLLEYLAAPIDPRDPAQRASRPWAYLRYTQRGHGRPWTEDFEKIVIEFANETWHNGAVESQWDGWHRDGWVHQGGHEFGLWAGFIGDHLRRHSPWYVAAADAGRIELAMGSNYSDYAETGIPFAPEVSVVGHTTYVGPRWETGDAPTEGFTEEGLQATLLGYVAGLDDEFDGYRRLRETLASRGHEYRLYAYEGGPSGYSLPGTAPEDAVETAERYGKSQAMAVAALDAWLGAYTMGFSEMAYLAFAQGDYWSSHTPIRLGFRPHAAWLALSLRNRHAEGIMIRTRLTDEPTMEWGAGREPLLGAYAFRDGARLSVFLLNRSLTEHLSLDLALPAEPVGPATRYALDGDPAATNRFAQDVRVETSPAVLGRQTRLVVPPGSVHVYVVETTLPDRGSPPSAVSTPRVEYRRDGGVVTWTPVPGAEGYRVYRGTDPLFRTEQADAVFEARGTSLTDADAVGGSAYYYRVAAVGAWGVGMASMVAAGGPNPLPVAYGASAGVTLRSGPGQVVVDWQSVPGASSYRLGYSPVGTATFLWREVPAVPGGLQSARIEGLVEDGLYRFALQTIGPAGRSPVAVVGTAVASGDGVLAAWDLDGSNSYEDAVQAGRGVVAARPTPLVRGPGLEAGEFGYHPMEGAFGGIPKEDWGNWGAPGGGSLENAVDRGLYFGFRLEPEAGQVLQFTGLRSGAVTYNAVPVYAALRYRVGNGPWTTARERPELARDKITTIAPLDFDLARESGLARLTQPVEFRLYFYSPEADARYCRVGLFAGDGEDLVVTGGVRAR